MEMVLIEEIYRRKDEYENTCNRLCRLHWLAPYRTIVKLREGYEVIGIDCFTDFPLPITHYRSRVTG